MIFQNWRCSLWGKDPLTARALLARPLTLHIGRWRGRDCTSLRIQLGKKLLLKTILYENAKNQRRRKKRMFVLLISAWWIEDDDEWWLMNDAKKIKEQTCWMILGGFCVRHRVSDVLNFWTVVSLVLVQSARIGLDELAQGESLLKHFIVV